MATRRLNRRLGLRLGCGTGAALAAVLLWAHPVHAALHHAALVIEHSSGTVLARCIAFAEDQISGIQLIQRSGTQYQAQTFGSMGSAVCQLDFEPTSVPSNCFGSDAYWQYFHWQGGWHPSSLGASSWYLHDGDMDGWRYASGAGQAPANVSYAAICNPVAPSIAASHATPAPATTYRAATGAPTTGASASPTVTPAIQALAPTASPTARSALASTGPPTQPKSLPIATWLLFAAAVILLGGLGAVNLRRRGP